MKENLSKFISLILRHKPEYVNITVDKHGWANVDDLITGINNKGNQLTFELLEDIVNTDSKQRYSFNEDKTKIRANQGHSINVDVELDEVKPPPILYHGTAYKYYKSIKRYGIIPKSRLYVHLSLDIETAKNVGTRHGSPLILAIDAKKMYKDGYKFFLSANNVWLTKEVPIEYFSEVDCNS